MTDTVSAEVVVYQYDALKRLTSASSTPNSGTNPAAWTQTLSYDGFGNLTGKTLNGSTTAIGVDATTNRLTNTGYDANGNMTGGYGGTLGYDEANRVVSFAKTSGGTEYYGYGPDNKRIYRLTPSGTTWNEEWTFYGARGERLLTNLQLMGPWQVYDSSGNNLVGWRSRFQGGTQQVWFAGKLVSEGTTVFADRVGTNRAGGARFYPYGDEIGSSANDRLKFGTYTRDSFTGLDYADQRYYASGLGISHRPIHQWITWILATQ